MMADIAKPMAKPMFRRKSGAYPSEMVSWCQNIGLEMMLNMLTDGSRSWAGVFRAVISNSCATRMCDVLHVSRSQGPKTQSTLTAIVEVSNEEVDRRARYSGDNTSQ